MSNAEQEKKKGSRSTPGRSFIAAASILIVGWYLMWLRGPSFSGDTASSIEITMQSPEVPNVKTEAWQTSITNEAACASLLALLRSARPHLDHKCGDVGSFRIHYTNGRMNNLAFLPGHDPASYEFRWGGGLYRIPRDRFYQVLREAGVDMTKMPASEH